MAIELDNRKKPMSSINVTPLVDVMLVLLVIFMITAPLMLNGIKITLPKTKETNSIKLNKQQVILSFTKTGEIFIGTEKILKEEIVSIVKDRFKNFNTDTLFLRADYSIKYGHVAKLMSFLKSNGISKIALVTQIER